MQAQILIFEVEQRQLALPLEAVERVLPAVEVTPLPGAPDYILGLIDVHGQLTPVLDLRRLLGVATRAVRAADRMIVARMAQWQAVLPVDAVQGVVLCDTAEVTAAASLVPGMPPAQGLLRHNGSIVMIYDMQHLLSSEQAAALRTLAGAAPAALR